MLAFLRNQTTPKKYNNLTYRKNNKRSTSSNNDNSLIHTSDTSLIFKKTKNNLKKIILANKNNKRQFTAKNFNHSRNFTNNQLTLQIENRNLKEKLTTLNGQIKMKNNEILKLQTESKKKKIFYVEMKKNYLKSLENLGRKVQKIKRTISCENIQEKNEKYEKVLKESKSKDIIIKNLKNN